MLTDLSIDDGSFAWKLCMDIVCLSYDGNLADAALIAAMGALMRLQLPRTRRIDDEIFLTEGEEDSARHVCCLELCEQLNRGQCCVSNRRQPTNC